MRTLNTLLKDGLTAKLATAPFTSGGTTLPGRDGAVRRRDGRRDRTGRIQGRFDVPCGRDGAARGSRTSTARRGSRCSRTRVDQSVWSLRNLGFTADPVGTTALNGASDPLANYDVIFSTANYPANTPANAIARARLTAFFAAGGGYLGGGAGGAQFITNGGLVTGLTAGTRAGNGRSGIVFWDNTGGTASPITGAYPSRDTAIVDPPTWFTGVPAGWSIDANLPIAGLLRRRALADRRRVGVGARGADDRARHEHDGRDAPADRVRVQPALPRRPGARVARPQLGRVLGGRRIGIDTNEYTRRREQLGELLARRGLDAIFVPPGSDLEYLTGIERDLPSFGQVAYAHGWVAGAFLAPGREPVYVLPRMFVRFHLDGQPPPGTIVVEDDGDGRAAFSDAVGELGSPTRIALGQRAWAETAVELLAVVPEARLSEGSSLVNELRRVKSEAELELMAHACLIARETMDAVTPDVVPGVSMSNARRARRARAARARLALPLLPDAHLHLGRAAARLGRARRARAAARGRGRPLRLRRRLAGLLLRLRPHRCRAASRRSATTR